MNLLVFFQAISSNIIIMILVCHHNMHSNRHNTHISVKCNHKAHYTNKNVYEHIRIINNVIYIYYYYLYYFSNFIK